MTEIGLFFGSSTGNCNSIARLIVNLFKPVEVHVNDVMDSDLQEISNFDHLIFGISTWDKDKLQHDWEDFLSGEETVSFSGKKIAIYGLGDQKAYPDNFLDGMGLLYSWLKKRKAEIVGFWPIDGYKFNRSAALAYDKFVGLALDEDTQYDQTANRLATWVDQLKKEFEL